MFQRTTMLLTAVVTPKRTDDLGILNILNETHSCALRSWVLSANIRGCDFPIQTPFATFRQAGSDESFRGGTAICDQVIDLGAARDLYIFDGLVHQNVCAAAQCKLNEFLSMGESAWSALRLALSRRLREGTPGRATVMPAAVR
jgi:fumarylacetoacetase